MRSVSSRLCGVSASGLRRCASAISSSGAAAASDSKATSVSATFVNRNPRHLEAAGLAPKPMGWEFQRPARSFHLKVTLRKTSTGTFASVVHNDGGVVVQASTDESAIRRQLYSPRDVCAARAVGAVLGRRCAQAGVTAVFVDELELPSASEKNSEFLKALADSGVQLSEPESVPAPEQVGVDYDALTVEERRSLFPGLLDEIRVAEDKTKYAEYPPTMRPLKNQERENKYQALAKVRRGWWWSSDFSRLVPPENSNNPFKE